MKLPKLKYVLFFSFGAHGFLLLAVGKAIHVSTGNQNTSIYEGGIYVQFIFEKTLKF
jgi:hypothetical protein